jgi:fatty acyl-CoA reductase
MYTQKHNEMEDSNIVQFYEDRSIFITGATGFMGKVLVEKLLRSCPGINRLYILMRPSKGKEVAVRLQELISNEVNNIWHIQHLQKLSKLLCQHEDFS